METLRVPFLRLIFEPKISSIQSKNASLSTAVFSLIGSRPADYMRSIVNEICFGNANLIELAKYMVLVFLLLFSGDKRQQKQNFITLKMPRNWRCMVLTCIQQKTQKVLISCWVFVPLVYLCIGTG